MIRHYYLTGLFIGFFGLFATSSLFALAEPPSGGVDPYQQYSPYEEPKERQSKAPIENNPDNASSDDSYIDTYGNEYGNIYGDGNGYAASNDYDDYDDDDQDYDNSYENDYENQDLDATFALNDDQLYELEQNYLKAIKKEQLKTAGGILKEIPRSRYTKEQRKQRKLFDIFDRVEKKVEEEAADFSKASDLPIDTQKTIKRLYKQAQVSILNNQPELAKDLLIQVLFLHRRNLKARELLKQGLDMKTGSYKIQDINKRYWKKSSVSFYGGNYGKSLEYLEVLAKIDNENPDIFDRIGSNYYMIGEKQKAIDAWTTAVFLNPENTELKTIIKRTEKMITKEVEEEKKRKKAKKDETKKEKKDVPKQLMGMFSNQTKAYNFARQYQKRGLGPIVEEMDDGRWSVSLPK